MQFDQLKRRDVLSLLGGTAVWPVAARQQSRKLPIVAFLDVSKGVGWSSYFDAFKQRLSELGWIEGRTVVVR